MYVYIKTHTHTLNLIGKTTHYIRYVLRYQKCVISIKYSLVETFGNIKFTETDENSMKLRLYLLGNESKKRSQGKLVKLMKKEHRTYAFVTEWIKLRDCISLCLFVLSRALLRCFFSVERRIEKRVCASRTARCSVGRIWTDCVHRAKWQQQNSWFVGNSYNSQEDHKRLIAVV